MPGSIDLVMQETAKEIKACLDDANGKPNPDHLDNIASNESGAEGFDFRQPAQTENE